LCVQISICRALPSVTVHPESELVSRTSKLTGNTAVHVGPMWWYRGGQHMSSWRAQALPCLLREGWPGLTKLVTPERD
jgi:hypothetical protein